MRKPLHLIIYVRARQRYTLSTKALISLSENAQQIEEEVDKVKVERQCTKQCHFLSALASIWCLQKHLFDLLRIVCRQSYKD